MKRVPRSHAAHREHLQLANFAAQLCRRFEPIDLAFLSPGVTLWNEHFPAIEPELLLTPLDVSPDRRLGNRMCGILLAQPHPNPVCGVSLFPRCLPVTL